LGPPFHPRKDPHLEQEREWNYPDKWKGVWITLGASIPRDGEQSFSATSSGSEIAFELACRICHLKGSTLQFRSVRPLARRFWSYPWHIHIPAPSSFQTRIELNGDWEEYLSFVHDKITRQQRQSRRQIRVLQDVPEPLPTYGIDK
jgi:hypothetical protein